MKELTKEQRALLEAHGAAVADQLETGGPDPAAAYNLDDLPPEVALREAAVMRAVALKQSDSVTRHAVDRARAAGYSWHKIAVPLGMTAEGARRRYARA